jgi:uncharacterized protein YgbK (DUF1537 family)
MNRELLLAYYGDDFTGSTDVLEALSRTGLRTVLFLKPPTPEQLKRLPGLRAFGIAGGSRTMTPEEMERELPPAFEVLKASGAPIVHYKMCSTFDSSPGIGSIGRAIEIGRRVFGQCPTPLVVGAPVLGRYVVFGNLFARSGLDTEPFRLDRHPTMSRHPVTPMKEADLRRILAEQTNLPVELVDVLQLEAVRGSWSVVRGSVPAPVILFDTLRQEHLPVIGKAIGEMAEVGQLFVAGSSGVEYALTAFWSGKFSAETERTAGVASDVFTVSSMTPFAHPLTLGQVEQIIAVSGSCSPVTDRQIARALASGFIEVPTTTDLVRKPAEHGRVVDAASAALRAGRSVIVHTCRGPGDTRLDRQMSTTDPGALGTALGRVLEAILGTSGLRRAVVCGGDTSMSVARALGLEALEYVAAVAPGSPLCRVHAAGRIADGCEIVFKGGQVGRDSFLTELVGKNHQS